MMFPVRVVVSEVTASIAPLATNPVTVRVPAPLIELPRTVRSRPLKSMAV
jgi:hypothetical protein